MRIIIFNYRKHDTQPLQMEGCLSLQVSGNIVTWGSSSFEGFPNFEYSINTNEIYPIGRLYE